MRKGRADASKADAGEVTEAASNMARAEARRRQVARLGGYREGAPVAVQ